MRRSVYLAFLVSILMLSALRTASACGGCLGKDAKAAPATGPLPLSVKVSGITWGWVPAIEIDMGGEATYRREFPWEECGAPYSAEHTFECPGTYAINVIDPDYPDYPATVTITVSAPSMPYLFVFADNSPHEAYLATHFYITERPFAYSTVDWGDGSAETFTWTRRGVYVGTPNHLYPADGEYTASVTNHYSGQYCSWDQTVTAVVKVPDPGTPTRPVTWGGVKALYR